MYTPIKKTEQKKRRHARFKGKVSGTAERPRLVVFRSLKHINAQLVNDEKGVTLAQANDMTEGKGTKTERAKQIGAELAKTAQKAGISSCVFDRNGYQYHGRVKALAEGAREGGLQF